MSFKCKCFINNISDSTPNPQHVQKIVQLKKKLCEGKYIDSYLEQDFI